jgi:tetratricopeptide (TPR) repeat protein
MPRVDVPYAPPVVALTREQYGRSLTETGHHAEAARQFLEAARLVQDDADQAAHARLAGAAAEALQRSGRKAEALAAYQRAARLFGDLGYVVARVRCLRSAAWLQLETPDAAGPDAAGPDAAGPDAAGPDMAGPEAAGPGGEALGVTTMRAVLSELESLTADSSSPELDAELATTRTQLDQMLALPAEDHAQTPAPPGEPKGGSETGLTREIPGRRAQWRQRTKLDLISPSYPIPHISVKWLRHPTFLIS